VNYAARLSPFSQSGPFTFQHKNKTTLPVDIVMTV